MLGIVIVSHGQLSVGLKDSAEVIIGKSEQIYTVSLTPGEDIQQLGETIKTTILAANQGEGVLVFVDLVSASPYNQTVININSLEETLQNQVFVIGGVNLPMLLEAINIQLLNTPLKEGVQEILKQGSKSIQSWHIAMAFENDEDEDNF